MANLPKDNTEFSGRATFVGGESQDSKFGTQYQYDYARHLDTRKKPSRFSVLPGMSKTSSGVVTDLVQDMTQVPNGNRYAIGDSGNVYLINNSEVWSKLGNLGQAGGGGILYRSDSDCVYITGQTKVARIKTVSTNPTLDVNFFDYGVSMATTCTASGGTNTYILPNAISESPIDQRPFISDIEPLYQIGVKVVNKGAGDWTMTIHDDANNFLGSSTLTNANIVNTQINYFVFSIPVRLLVSINNFTSTSSGGRTYHFHLTTNSSTQSDAMVQTTTTNSLVDADMQLYATALVQPNNGLHPIYQFTDLTLFGNEKYVASYAPLQDQPNTDDFLRHQLQFPPGNEVNGMAQLELYVAITTEQRSTNAIRNYQSGKLFLWDGSATTYNRFFDIPEGSPESIFSHKNILHLIAGGAYYQSTGGQPVKIRTIRNTDTEYSNIADSTHSYPHMMTVRRGILLMGYPSVTTNQKLEHVVYGYGSINSQFPASWTTNYSMSTGTILNNGSNNLRIGMVKSYGDTLYMSWRDDSVTPNNYGVDLINNSSLPANDFQIQLLHLDNNQPYKQKLAKKALAIFEPLPTDNSVSMRMWYRIDNETTKHYSTDDGTPYVTSGNVVQISIPKEYIDLQVGLEGTIASGAAVTPQCRGVYVQYDLQPDRSEVSQ